VKLFCTENSPFSRVARVLVIELGLEAIIEITTVTVRDKHSQLLAYTASGKVPALYLGSSRTLCDTRMIAQYLGHIAGQVNVVASVDEIEDYAFEGFCLSVLESFCVWVREARRDPGQISQQLIELERARAIRCLGYLEEQVERLEQRFTLAAIAIACALDIADRRLGFTTDKQHPKLQQWLVNVNSRASMQASVPQKLLQQAR